MPRFSANLGFLWSELSLPDAILAAHKAGFDAVECHWPYAYPPESVLAALKETGLPMLALNTPRGDVSRGDFGLCAIPARQDEAKRGMIDAISYASQIGAKAVHVMAGKALPDQACHRHFIDMVAWAADQAEPHGIEIWIEAINPIDVPGYFLHQTRQAIDILTSIPAKNIGLMFDCYHVGRMNGNILHELEYSLPWIRHIQIAAVPDRGEPDQGHIDYQPIYRWLDEKDYTGFIGAEYHPRQAMKDGLGWLSAARSDMLLG